jgi:hypothetical protein
MVEQVVHLLLQVHLLHTQVAAAAVQMVDSQQDLVVLEAVAMAVVSVALVVLLLMELLILVAAVVEALTEHKEA